MIPQNFVPRACDCIPAFQLLRKSLLRHFELRVIMAEVDVSEEGQSHFALTDQR